MYDKHAKGLSYTAGFFMLIAFTVASIILASIISIPVWKAMTGTSFLDMEKNMTNPAFADAYKVIQVITMLIGFLLPAVFTAFLLSRKPSRLMGFPGKITSQQAGLVILVMISALFVSGSLGYLNQQIPLPDSLKLRFDNMEDEYMQQMEAIIGLNNIGQLIISLLIMALLPAFCEEALFRGGFQNFLNRATNNPWVSIITVSLIFSAAHLSWYGFLPRLFLGLILGVIYHYSGRLWLSILAHFLNNAIALVMLYAYKQQGKPVDEAMSEAGDMAYWGFLALPLVIALLVIFIKRSPKPVMDEKPDPVNDLLRNTPFEK
ncbi:MAG TPA: type II CAAX endopeptidase family protein [Chitinophagaceae bacterium]|nr:CPBP family intramembrane metalloprotease [Chitinophagaceae bacterium]MCB9055289.1 CPBP family intramembrane metalloprotease [Chitinophagales bacterium]HRX92575.1 type II CAAX endopeptidase family protein [Chitinophagaceae bacterium]